MKYSNIHEGIFLERPNRFIAHVKINGEKTVLMGDFNVTPDDPVLDPIRERLTDTATVFESEKLSFPSDKPDRKIDYIFVSRDVKVDAADIPPIVASDHRPHTAVISF